MTVYRRWKHEVTDNLSYLWGYYKIARHNRPSFRKDGNFGVWFERGYHPEAIYNGVKRYLDNNKHEGNLSLQSFVSEIEKEMDEHFAPWGVEKSQ